MKRVLPLLLIVFVLLVAAKVLSPISKSKFKEAAPSGMVLVKRGAFLMGTYMGKTDNTWGTTNDTMKVSIESFWMDETEVTNYLYKQFAGWVKDSIIRESLVAVDPLFKPINKITGDSALNWNRKIDWRSKKPEYQEILKSFFVLEKSTNRKYFNTNRINYLYTWVDKEKSSRFERKQDIKDTDFRRAVRRIDSIWLDSSYLNSDWKIETVRIARAAKKREDFISTIISNIYPDTTCWKVDFRGEQNDMYLNQYFAHKSFNNYPVVGVSWEQANAFCNWRTKVQQNRKTGMIEEYRLPTEAEWEYAARGGRNGKVNKLYPWKDESLKDKNGCYFANFKAEEGNFPLDGFIITAPVGSFPPNELGLFELVGNVSEWTGTAYFTSGNKLMSTMNPNVSLNALYHFPYDLKKKVVRGGSYKDIFEKINTNLRDWKYQNDKAPDVGFRCVRTALP